MKIRIKGNSIRLRLGKSEVAQFAEKGYLQEHTSFGNGIAFSYALIKSSDIDEVKASFENNTISISVSDMIANQWTQTDEVGFQHKQALTNGEELFLLVEKDFVCLDNTIEDQSDNYPNPNAVC
jgi:hypothetical protein